MTSRETDDQTSVRKSPRVKSARKPRTTASKQPSKTRKKSFVQAEFESVDPSAESAVAPSVYDEYLLERARTQWQFGDWEKLASLENEPLKDHPDRARLAALCGAGYLHLGQFAEARKFLRLAKEWGCPRRVLAQVCVSSVFNTLGRVAALSGDEARSHGYFLESIDAGQPGADQRLLGMARIGYQLSQMGMSQGSLQLLRETRPQMASKRLHFSVAERVQACFEGQDLHEAAEQHLQDESLTFSERAQFFLGIADELRSRKDTLLSLHFVRQAKQIAHLVDEPTLASILESLITGGRSEEAADLVFERSLSGKPPLSLDQKTADAIAKAHAATRERAGKTQEHGHDLLLDWLKAHLPGMSKTSPPRVLIEIGSTREDVPGQGSTAKVASFCKAAGLHFITVDMDPRNTQMAARLFSEMNVAFEAVTMKGEDYLRAYHGRMDFVFLDAYDFDHGKHSEWRQSRYERFLGARIDEQQCHRMHLDCAESALGKLSPDGAVCVDDTWLDAEGRWTAKGTLAMPFLLENGFSVADARNRAALLVRKPQ